jgi:hypothetical protein
MPSSACPTCATPYTPAEVVGVGILRARPAKDGGPLVEYRCAGCDRILTLVPHGEGRYAPPGVPPPDSVPESERLPAWVRAGRPAPPPRPAASSAAEPASGTGPPVTPVPPGDGAAPTLLEAYELLGLSLTATREQAERAFRERSLTCHPDKVAHLDDDFRALAERKFKRLVAAFRLVEEVLPT